MDIDDAVDWRLIARKAQAEIERLRAANKKLFEMLSEAPCDTHGTSVARCLESGQCCCAIEDYKPGADEQSTRDQLYPRGLDYKQMKEDS